MIWYDNNCEVCKAKCNYKRNIDFGFLSGEITLKTAEFIGFENNKLSKFCQNKDKVKKVVKYKQINNIELWKV